MKGFIKRHRYLVVASGVSLVLVVAVGILSQNINFTPPAVNAGVKRSRPA